MQRALVGLCALAGCGRIGFSVPATATRDGAPVDSPAATGADTAVDTVDADIPVALVQTAAPGYGSDGTSIPATIAATAGDLLVAAVYWNQSPDTLTVSDTLGLAWASLPSQVLTTAGCGGGTGNATAAQLYYAQLGASGSSTVTVSQTSGVQPLGVILLEYAGLATADLVDTTNGGIATASSSTVTMPSLTTTSRDAVVALVVDTIGQGTMSAVSGFTREATDPGFPSMVEDAIVPAGTYVPTATLPPGHDDDCWLGAAAALRTADQ